MAKTIQEIQTMMVDQLKRRGFYPKEEKEVLLRLGEELGEVFEVVRENQSFENLSEEVVDLFWNLLRFCELKGIDLENAFMKKYEKNEKRFLPKPVIDVSENA